MTTPRIATVEGVVPIVEIGIGDTRTPQTNSGRWDLAHWDSATDAYWSGGEPSWVDVTCDVRAVESHVGHDRALDSWEVGTCSITLDNTDGWADIVLDNPLGPDLTMRPGRAVRWGVRYVAAPSYTIPGTTGVPGYLTATVGSATTPDPGPLPAQCTFVFKVRGPTGGTGNQVVVAQYETVGNLAWQLRRWADTAAAGALRLVLSANGTAAATDAQLIPTVPIDGADEELAVAVTTGATTSSRIWQRLAGTWTPAGALQTLATTTVFDSSSVVRIGNRSTTPAPWNGRIYSVELRTGLDPAAGTVLWRFDADDYPGTGTSYVDPRGRTWTLTNAAAITPTIPAVPPVDVPADIRTVWRFRGFIDGMSASYDGQTAAGDTVTLDCIDALGEAGRPRLTTLAVPVGDGEGVSARLERILDAADWRPEWRAIAASSVAVMGTDLDGRAIDLLSATADTAGGSIFGDYEGRVAFRGRDWQTWLPDTAADVTVGNTAAATVCPSTLTLSFPRSAALTRALVNYEGADTPPRQADDADAQLLYGLETAPERLDLQTTNTGQLDLLAQRLLATHGAATMPRVEALTLNAGRDRPTMLAILGADPQQPTRWHLLVERRPGDTLIDRQLLVVAVAHSWDARGWQATVTLDDAAPWAAAGGRWDTAGWDQATWTNAVRLLADAVALLEGVTA